MFNGNISMKFYDMSHFARLKGKKTVQRAHCALVVQMRKQLCCPAQILKWTIVQLFVALLYEVGIDVKLEFPI